MQRPSFARRKFDAKLSKQKGIGNEKDAPSPLRAKIGSQLREKAFLSKPLLQRMARAPAEPQLLINFRARTIKVVREAVQKPAL